MLFRVFYLPKTFVILATHFKSNMVRVYTLQNTLQTYTDLTCVENEQAEARRYTVKPVSRDQSLSCDRGQGKSISYLVELITRLQDSQPYPIGAQSHESDGHPHKHTNTQLSTYLEQV